MPQVSDFDTFCIGSTGPMTYTTLAEDQQDLVVWSLAQTQKLLLDQVDLGLRDHFRV